MSHRPPAIRAAFEGECAPRESGRFVRGHSYSVPTQFKPGERVSVATEIKPGQRLSIATEIKPGTPAHNHLPVGSERVRREERGKLRAWVKVAEPSRWRLRAVVVWEKTHGPLPAGKVVHHRDRNSLNDNPSNLQALTRAEHTAEHRRELVQKAAEALESGRPTLWVRRGSGRCWCGAPRLSGRGNRFCADHSETALERARKAAQS